MSQDQELEIRRQFLGEADAHLRILDRALDGLAHSPIVAQNLAAARRAAHSIKGGAGMLGLVLLSDLARRLEDGLKALSSSTEIDLGLESLFLTIVDRLRWVLACDRQELRLNGEWIANQVNPLFVQLQQRLDATPTVSTEPESGPESEPESGPESGDIVALFFETTIADHLQQLEALLEEPTANFGETVTAWAEELEQMGEMLQIPDFARLCHGVQQALAEQPDQTVVIAQSALQTWRRSQFLILSGQREHLPTTIDWVASIADDLSAAPHRVADDMFSLAEADAIRADPAAFGLIDDGLPAGNHPDTSAYSVSHQTSCAGLIATPGAMAAIAAEQALPADDRAFSNTLINSVVDRTINLPAPQFSHNWVSQLTIAHDAAELQIRQLRQLANNLRQWLQTVEQKPPASNTESNLTANAYNLPVLEQASRNGNQFLFKNYDSADHEFESIEIDVLEISHLSAHLQSAPEAIAQCQKLIDDIELGLDRAEQTTDQLHQTVQQLQTELLPAPSSRLFTPAASALIWLVESKGMLLAFSPDAIQAICWLAATPIFTDAGQQWLNWQGDRVPLLQLEHGFVFHPPAASVVPSPTPSAYVLLVRQDHQLIGLPIDRCWGEQAANLHQLEHHESSPIGFSRCAMLADGRVIPLVDIPELLRWIPRDQLGLTPVLSNLTPELPTSAVTKSTILIVDDSSHARNFLALTLERAGYQVEQAADGQAALHLLAAGLVVAAIICDIEMPGLDGLGFLARLKADRLSYLPVAMLTSRDDHKCRQLAQRLGAMAYFTKPYNERDLLDTVAQMVQPLPEPTHS
jgi:chemotaxis protein histidine kinase CheA/ActR/RegA family two-component response regulator